MIAKSTSAPSQEAPYEWTSWLWGGAVLGLTFLYFVFFWSPVRRFQPSPYPVEIYKENAYLIVHMPSIASRGDFSHDRAESWLAALSAKGYRPALLSEVHRRLSEGRHLPSKTVVLVFDPGYRATFHVMAPLLAKYKFPAVWVTENRGGDRRYLNNHTLKAMSKSGVWDVGRYKDGDLMIAAPDGRTITLGANTSVWRANAGRFALNRGLPEGELNRLHVNWNWTEQQLIDRFLAEAPARGKSYLTFKKIQNHNWGVAVPATTGQDPAFTLRAPIDARTAHLSWLGTKWTGDARMDLDVSALSGELWLLMRSDEEKGENVGVCFSNGKVSIARHEKGRKIHLLDAVVPALQQPARFGATVVLSGSYISVIVNGDTVAQYAGLPSVYSKDGIVRLMVYDKIVGSAQAEGVRLSMIPLAKNTSHSEMK